MRKFWILLFALVPVAVLGLFLWAPAHKGLWFPDNIAPIGHEIDGLFYLILWITGIVFFLVNACLVWFLWKYGRKDLPGKSVYSHGNHRLEIAWTIVPAIILTFLVFYQFSTWKKAKFLDYAPESDIHAEVLAGQFEWRIRYPFPETHAKRNDEEVRLWKGGELEMVNELHVVKDQPTLLRIRSRDVIHSFFIPEARLKQDVMPGFEKEAMWFSIEKAGTYEFACAELCGWGHYKMKGHLIVHETQADYEAWYQQALAAQHADQKDLDYPE